MNNRYFPPSRSLLSAPGSEPWDSRIFDEQKMRSMKEQRLWVPAPSRSSSGQLDRPRNEDQQRTSAGRDSPNDRKRPRIEKKVLNELDHPKRPPVNAFNEAEVLDEARRYLDVDLFAVAPDDLPTLLTSMLNVEQSLEKVLARKIDIKEKMTEMYEKERNETRFCLGKLEDTIEGLPAGVPGAASDRQRQWLHNARMAFLKIDLADKSRPSSSDPGPTLVVAPQQSLLGEPARPRSKTPTNLAPPPIQTAVPSASFTNPPVPLHSLTAIDFSVPPPSMELASTSAIPDVSQIDFSRPPPIPPLLAMQNKWPESTNLMATETQINAKIGPRVELKNLSFVAEEPTSFSLHSSGNLIPIVNPSMLRPASNSYAHY